MRTRHWNDRPRATGFRAGYSQVIASRHHRAAHLVRVRREAPIISGYSMPQSFARTDAVDSPAMQQSFPVQSQAVSSGFADGPRARSVARAAGERNTALDAAIARHAAANGLPVDNGAWTWGKLGFVPSGSHLGDGSLIGVRTVPPTAGTEPGTSWLGSPRE